MVKNYITHDAVQKFPPVIPTVHHEWRNRAGLPIRSKTTFL